MIMSMVPDFKSNIQVDFKSCHQKAVDLLEPGEFNYLVHSGDSELDSDFICFAQNYTPLSELLPKHFTIVDCGCYQAMQCHLFRDFKAYIGVDNYDKPSRNHGDYRPPLRATDWNVVHYKMDITSFISYCPEYREDPNTYFIASAVPDFAQTLILFRSVKNCFVAYPGGPLHVKGFMAEEILRIYSNTPNL